jgi:hypothetical protein
VEVQAEAKWDGHQYHFKKTKAEPREARFGKVRPIIHADFQGYKLVAAGSRMFYEKSEQMRTVPDFLKSYLPGVLDRDWGNAEIKKSYEQRHPIMQWYDDMCHYERKQKKIASGVYEAVPNGSMWHYYLLAYDLFCLEDNGAYQAAIVKRLKHPDQFQGARYEVFAAATCVRAGFKIAYEDEGDISKKHDEFVATLPNTKVSISVEAKSRHRPGVLGFKPQSTGAGNKKVGIEKLLRRAVDKNSSHPKVVFLDVNLPPTELVIGSETFEEIFDSIKSVADRYGENSFEAIVVTNHPFHYVKGDTPAPTGKALTIFSKKYSMTALPPEHFQSLRTALDQFGKIPNNFHE